VNLNARFSISDSLIGWILCQVVGARVSWFVPPVLWISMTQAACYLYHRRWSSTQARVFIIDCSSSESYLLQFHHKCKYYPTEHAFSGSEKVKRKKLLKNFKLVYALEKMIDLESIKVINLVNHIRACETRLIVVGLMNEFSWYFYNYMKWNVMSC